MRSQREMFGLRRLRGGIWTAYFYRGKLNYTESRKVYQSKQLYNNDEHVLLFREALFEEEFVPGVLHHVISASELGKVCRCGPQYSTNDQSRDGIDTALFHYHVGIMPKQRQAHSLGSTFKSRNISVPMWRSC